MYRLKTQSIGSGQGGRASRPSPPRKVKGVRKPHPHLVPGRVGVGRARAAVAVAVVGGCDAL